MVISYQWSRAIQLATSTTEIEQCCAVLSQLHPHLKIDNFVQQVQQQIKSGYQLAYLSEDEKIIGVAGFNISLSLSWRK